VGIGAGIADHLGEGASATRHLTGPPERYGEARGRSASILPARGIARCSMRLSNAMV
jgi:hypothetical protein